MTIFTIAHTDYETYCPHHLIAPEGTTPEQFTKLCDDLIEPAVDELIRRNGRAIYPPDEELDDFKTWIGWDGIVETIAKKLLRSTAIKSFVSTKLAMNGPLDSPLVLKLTAPK